MTTSPTLLAALGAALLLQVVGIPGSASATLIPIAQDRSVSADGRLRNDGSTVAQDSDASSAPGLGAFSETAEVDLSYGPTATVRAGATQESSIGNSLVTAIGQSTVEVQQQGDVTGEGGANSVFIVDLELLSDALWAFEAAATGEDVEINLLGPGFSSIVSLAAFEGEGETFSGVLALPAGSYRISAGAFVDMDFGEGTLSSEFSLSFAEVPEAGTGALLGAGILGLALRRSR